MNKYLKIIIPILFGLAVILGFLQRKNIAEFSFGQNRQTLTRVPSQDSSLQDYYQKAQDLYSKQNQTSTATFLAVGDIMLSRNVAQAIKNSGNINKPFLPMSAILNGTDFNFGNLESPVAPKYPIVGGHSLIFGAASSTLLALKDYKFQILNLANNHALDQGLAGINSTISSLDYFAIAHVGTGNSLEEAWQPAQVTTKNGIKICFIGASYASINDSGKTLNSYVARIQDLDRLKTSIKESKSLCDFVVVTLHAGTEYTRYPNLEQTTFAHSAIDYGADIVIGAHPHWVQTIEKYQGKYIFYSLGNFIFDQEWSQETKEGLTLKITVSKKQSDNPTIPKAAKSEDLQGGRISATISSIELIPVIVEDYSTPRMANEIESAAILKKINQTQTILYP